MRLDLFIISIVIFSVLISGSSMMLISLNNDYNSDMNQTDFRDTYSKIDDAYSISSGVNTNVYAMNLSGEEQTEDSMFKGAYQAVRQTQNTYDITTSVASSIQNATGIPVFYYNATITIIQISIGFAILYLIFRFVPR